MHYAFAPGCALSLYKPQLITKTIDFLNTLEQNVVAYTACCKRLQPLDPNLCIINASAACANRYSSISGFKTKLLWDFFAASTSFPFPNYQGMRMTLHDACPTRNNPQVHDTVRILLKKMNITLEEAPTNRQNSFCCGDSFYGTLSTPEVKEKMRQRADVMPCDDVVVYCGSCIKAMQVGGKKPRYLLDLLFGEPTGDALYDPDAWHSALKKYIDAH